MKYAYLAALCCLFPFGIFMDFVEASESPFYSSKVLQKDSSEVMGVEAVEAQDVLKKAATRVLFIHDAEDGSGIQFVVASKNEKEELVTTQHLEEDEEEKEEEERNEKRRTLLKRKRRKPPEKTPAVA